MEILVETVGDDYARTVFRYKMALHDWSAARLRHQPGSFEVLEATRLLEELEACLQAGQEGSFKVRYPLVRRADPGLADQVPPPTA